MSVRANYIIEDIQKCIYAVMNSLAGSTSPWTGWTVILNYPETEMFVKMTKPIIYVEPPTLINYQRHQGGYNLGEYEMIIGAWDDRRTGGTEEINIISSRILNLFRTGCPTTAFNVVTSETYTGTTLVAQGVRVENIVGPREIETEDFKEFRREFTLFIRA